MELVSIRSNFSFFIRVIFNFAFAQNETNQADKECFEKFHIGTL